MKGHIAKKGVGKTTRYYGVINLGMQPARRCPNCHRRVWVDGSSTPTRCRECGGDLVDQLERRQQWTKGFTTRKDADREMREILTRLDTNTFVAPSHQTVGRFLLDEWLPAIASTVRPSTLLSYQGHVEHHINPRVGHVSLQKLGATHINKLYADLLERGRADGSGALSPTTVRRVHATLHRALRDAARWNKIPRNPADTADPPKTSSQDSIEMTTWDPPTLRTFLEATEDDRLYALWHLLASTGMRRGEALGLKWEDIDLKAERASIRRALVKVGYEIAFAAPKTKRSIRQIALDSGTVAVLRAHRARQLEDRMQWGAGYVDGGLVFTRENGVPLHPDSVSKLFETQVRRSGAPRIRLHDLRHTHATLALQAGVHPKVVSERLGHATVSITLDIYSHAIPAMQEDAAARVASIVFGEPR